MPNRTIDKLYEMELKFDPSSHNVLELQESECYLMENGSLVNIFVHAERSDQCIIECFIPKKSYIEFNGKIILEDEVIKYPESETYLNSCVMDELRKGVMDYHRELDWELPGQIEIEIKIEPNLEIKGLKLMKMRNGNYETVIHLQWSHKVTAKKKEIIDFGYESDEI